ncbi:MAG: alpha/beta hydrolase [Pseudomonadota bacterium]
MKSRLLFALMLAACAPSFGADAAPVANRYASTLVAAERFEVGSMLVERHGSKGSPMIMIPGLVSGAWAWQDAARRFMGEHVVYVVTLAGFDGRPALPGKVMEMAQQSLGQLITSRKLVKPVLVGHSLGGILSIAYAEQHSELIGGVVALEGLPVFPGTEQMPVAQRPQMAEGMKARMAGVTAEGFALQQQQYMRGAGVTDIARADELAKLTARSDPGAMVQYMGDALALDLRADLPKIGVPVLMLAPYFDVDASQRKLTEAMTSDYYTALMAGTSNLKVVIISPARHFAMFDQPQKVNEAIGEFMRGLQ